ncbi:MAG: hypothetical protein RL246_235 [Bacteroidota bacterium]|jgi:uncharacterized protein YdeI (YjbR/CyaY-like superfamily)
MNPSVDPFFMNLKVWREELLVLRSLVLECGLTEEIKWSAPCYVQGKSNVIIIQGFKEYCALMFFKGALLKDEKGLLRAPGQNTQSGRLIPFTSLEQIIEQADVLKAYIHEAIDNEKAGLKVVHKQVSDYPVPEELTDMFLKKPALKKAFEGLTPGRQRAYLLHFSEPKQSATRVTRIERMEDKIMNGKGMTDCWCGLSKRMPTCDGSHRQLQTA